MFHPLYTARDTSLLLKKRTKKTNSTIENPFHVLFGSQSTYRNIHNNSYGMSRNRSQSLIETEVRWWNCNVLGHLSVKCANARSMTRNVNAINRSNRHRAKHSLFDLRHQSIILIYSMTMKTMIWRMNQCNKTTIPQRRILSISSIAILKIKLKNDSPRIYKVV